MKLRTLAFVLGIGIFIVIVILLTVKFFTVGKLVITTNNKFNSITVSQANVQVQGSGFPKQGSGNLSLSLNSGSYIVAVQGNSVATSQIVEIKSHSTQTLNINPPAATGVEPVTYDSPEDFAADGSHLVYLNSTDSTVNELSAGNAHTKFGGGYNFQTIAWADPTYGVAQDASGKFFIINNGSITPLASPVSGSAAIFDIAPDRTIYVALANNVYRGTAAGGFKEIYDDRTAGTLLVAGSNELAIINGGESEEGSTNASGSNDAGLIVIDSSGKTIKKDISPVAASWSESGNYLAISTQTGGEILDSSLNQVAIVPQNGFSTPVWLDDNVIYYKIQDVLWSYNLQNQKAQIVANMPLGEAIQEMTVSTDKSYVYLTTADDNNNLALRRVALRGQGVPEIIFNLQDILPQTNQDPNYTLGLYNFSGTPTVTVTPGAGENAQNVLQVAKQNLQSDGFNLSQLQVELNLP